MQLFILLDDVDVDVLLLRVTGIGDVIVVSTGSGAEADCNVGIIDSCNNTVFCLFFL